MPFSKNQADLQNPCAFQKIRRIYRILALFKKSGGFTESLRFTEKQADDRILAGVKIPAPGEKTSGTGKNWRPAYCLGLVESPAADFLLVWLKSSRSDPRRCDVPFMQSPSEETAQAALLLWADSLPYCTGCLYRPDMPKSTRKSKN